MLDTDQDQAANRAEAAVVNNCFSSPTYNISILDGFILHTVTMIHSEGRYVMRHRSPRTGRYTERNCAENYNK